MIRSHWIFHGWSWTLFVTAIWLVGWVIFRSVLTLFFIISFMLISGSWNSLFRHIWNWEWIISICVRFMRRILLFFELKKLFNLPPNLVLLYFSLVLESETCFGELQWKCWIVGIDTCWKSKGCSNISRVHDFLFHSWWVNHVTLSLSLSIKSTTLLTCCSLQENLELFLLQFQLQLLQLYIAFSLPTLVCPIEFFDFLPHNPVQGQEITVLSSHEQVQQVSVSSSSAT